MPVDHSQYLRTINCCTRTIVGPPGPPGPEGPEGPEGPPGTALGTLQYTVALEQSGVSTSFCLAGVDPLLIQNQVAQAQTATYSTPFAVYNNHVYLTVNTITPTDPLLDCQITITGTSLSESTAIPVPGDTETITFSASAATSYQSIKKWLYVSEVALTSNIASINYDIANLGYVDFLNRDATLIGYRLEVLQDDNSANGDIQFIIGKIKQDGVETSIVELENINIIGAKNNGIGNQIVDGVRTGAFLRSYTMPSGTDLWPADTDFIVKQADFNSYDWTNAGLDANENIVFGSNNEGLLLRIRSTNLGAPSGPRYVSLVIYFSGV